MTANNHNQSNGTSAGGEPLTVVIVLDKSGSMQPLRETVVEAYNLFCQELQTEEGEVPCLADQFRHRLQPPLRRQATRGGAHRLATASTAPAG